MELNARSSADLRNKYNEVSNQIKAELELLKTLAEEEDDVQNRRVRSIKSFDDLRESLVDRRIKNV